ncbi:CinA family protein [Novosphingobium sp. CCH12-A3]|uniref:CinA family protein n=1 Tax=Novosphingobium sp. CCH12-A3 TaxID=1768752 RepID=UPI0009E92D9F|nr:CinA family protein [Novosphingobium sp. CCH12-A3]
MPTDDLPDGIESAENHARKVLAQISAAGLTVATAESCTGGLLASLLTDIEGGSSAFDRGFVTYSAASKTEMLGVQANVIAMFGVVSREVALAMSQGALENSSADIALAITGFAGPGGARDEAGLVHLAASGKGHLAITRECHFGLADRALVRQRSINAALEMLEEACERLTDWRKRT